ncbi:uncharacterized protein PV07_10848 [Cladophialophora immunda]|uniref:Uncharacterized protein n=2 Tax=Cladophialophora immunda TaxID=569365 RepID=A0A0D2BVY8_9EURO|nr:uncharacterized protein PV07_10848 [Cladophialophora immunda]KIW22560.1 hypothetical protein PV07_10848 [Cladophialophora immunda]OQV02359.1 hypothetical protein CLAIMM_07569 isoform 2 [Cladophialophora immunda]
MTTVIELPRAGSEDSAKVIVGHHRRYSHTAEDDQLVVLEKMPQDKVPLPETAFLSLHPLEPVLQFETAGAAESFREKCPFARILYPVTHPNWVYITLPKGLLGVFTKHGRMGFAFEHYTDAKFFDCSIKGVGDIREGFDHKHWKVYVPKEKW